MQMRLGRIARIPAQRNYLPFCYAVADFNPRTVKFQMREKRILAIGVFDDDSVARNEHHVHFARNIISNAVNHIGYDTVSRSNDFLSESVVIFILRAFSSMKLFENSK